MPRILRGRRAAAERGPNERDFIVTCVSLYPEDDARLDRIVASGYAHPRSRSGAIRVALAHYEQTVINRRSDKP